MRKIDANYYFITKYILLEIYLSSKYNGKKVRVKLVREVYLIDKLKAKILFSTNVIDSKKINLVTLRNKTYIGSYDIIVIINLRSRSKGITRKSIVISKQATLSSYS